MTTSIPSLQEHGVPLSSGCSLAAEAFGDVLEGMRYRRNLSPEAVASRAGISIVDLYMFENGQTEPKLGVLLRLADAVDVSPAWILDEVVAWISPHECPDVSCGQFLFGSWSERS